MAAIGGNGVLDLMAGLHVLTSACNDDDSDGDDVDGLCTGLDGRCMLVDGLCCCDFVNDVVL